MPVFAWLAPWHCEKQALQDIWVNGLGPHALLFVATQASPLPPASPLPSPAEMSPAPSPVEGWNQYTDMVGAFSLQWQVTGDIITFILSAGTQGVQDGC